MLLGFVHNNGRVREVLGWRERGDLFQGYVQISTLRVVEKASEFVWVLRLLPELAKAGGLV